MANVAVAVYSSSSMLNGNIKSKPKKDKIFLMSWYYKIQCILIVFLLWSIFNWACGASHIFHLYIFLFMVLSNWWDHFFRSTIRLPVVEIFFFSFDSFKSFMEDENNTFVHASSVC